MIKKIIKSWKKFTNRIENGNNDRECFHMFQLGYKLNKFEQFLKKVFFFFLNSLQSTRKIIVLCQSTNVDKRDAD